ncbi:MAG TPA: class I SAM-dependent methyltransferase [Chthoniobacterales bacterium]|nr:class I SAM-dependent methyltransferase [Chthoniobacterales bacterium]
MSSQQTYYDRYWTEDPERYSGSRAGYAPNFRRWMAKNLDSFPHEEALLEVGCGDASFTSDLARYSDDVTALDISAEQVALNAAKLPQVRFLVHDLAQPLPFQENTFGAIWCSEVLEHLFDPAFALREMFRVLKPGGLLLVTVPYHGLFKNVCIALFKWDHHFDPEYPHIRFFTRNTLGNLARKAGFAEIELETCGMRQPLRDFFIPTNLLLRARKAA